MAIRETLEREVKLRAGAEFRLPELGGEALESRVFTSTYHDTVDHRLARRGVTLRYRVENGEGAWQLKLPHGVARLELEAPGAAKAPPRELAALLVAYLRGRKLRPVARLRTRREGVRANGAEVVHDTVAVIEDRRVTRSFEELEVELLDGDEKTLGRLEKARVARAPPTASAGRRCSRRSTAIRRTSSSTSGSAPSGKVRREVAAHLDPLEHRQRVVGGELEQAGVVLEG